MLAPKKYTSLNKDFVFIVQQNDVVHKRSLQYSTDLMHPGNFRSRMEYVAVGDSQILKNYIENLLKAIVLLKLQPHLANLEPEKEIRILRIHYLNITHMSLIVFYTQDISMSLGSLSQKNTTN